MTPSKILFLFSLSFIFGVALSSFFSINQIYLLIALIFALFLISIFWKKNKVLIFSFLIFFFIFGIFRHQTKIEKIEKFPLKNFFSLEVELVGIIEKEPEVRENQYLTLKVKEIKNLEIKGENLGKVLIITQKFPLYHYGDKIKVFGEIKRPQKFNKFDFSGYLKKEEIIAQIIFPQIEIVSKKEGNFILEKLLSLKEKLKEGIEKNLPFEQASLLSAMLFGQKKEIPKELKENLSKSGLSHIAVISGLHVTILFSLLFSFFVGLGFWRQQAIIFSIIFIILFIIFTGFQPSAGRAGIMGSFFLLSQYFGREYSSFRPLFLSCAIMLFQNPLLLKYDLSFQLSFLAMLGITTLFPIFKEIFRKFPNFFGAKDLFLMTLSAQYFTFPLLIYNFGYFPLFSFLANILVVPLLPIIIFLGFISSLTNLIFPFLGFIFSLFCFPFLFFILKIAQIFSHFGLFSIEISWQGLIFLYFILSIISHFLIKKFSQPFFLR